ncbi:MAG: radical SAM domain-containing protein [Desulfosalsimonas sp.]|uniref:radical SAM protein n=1 Tax=Desulfosalsimonas sp. TaxID=3073848 RepID=UPI003970B61F
MTTRSELIQKLSITPEKQGAVEYIKISYPLRYGCYGEIRTPAHIFEFQPNGEIRTIAGRTGGWLTSAEWLKRTAGNDWQYFSAGGYAGALNYTGEYYVPCLPYQTNALFGVDAFERQEVGEAFAAWHRLRRDLQQLDTTQLPEKQSAFVKRIRAMNPEILEHRGRRLHEIIGGPVTVLPPDCRHVEYDVIPVAISKGCLYNCRFCRVKSGRGFSVHPQQAVEAQLRELAQFYGANRINYNSVFLGQHDALHAGADPILFAARRAWDILEIGRSLMKEPRLFLFGSVDSMLAADHRLFAGLNDLSFYTYINIGLESGDTATLSALGKPLNAEKVTAAFDRMMEINQQYNRVEVTANFVIGADLPESHLPSILELTRSRLAHFYPKGAVYLSPLEHIGDKNRLLTRFNELKTRSRLPAYIYLIQRL